MKKNIKLLCLILILAKSQFGYAQIISIKDSSLGFERKIIQRPYFLDFQGNLSLIVKEVYEPWVTCEPYSDDFGMFSYCGDVMGGIKNLLQTDSWATPHLRFENQPSENRKVYFLGIGTNVRQAKSINQEKNPFLDMLTNIKNSDSVNTQAPISIDCRAIILKIMEKHFEFEVKETEEFLDLLELHIVDTNKLYKLTSPIQHCIEESGGHGYTDSIPGIYIAKCLPLWFIVDDAERQFNTYAADMTGDPKHYYSFRMPRKYIEPNLTLVDLNSYLEENMGIKFFRKEKAIKSKVYTIKFKNGKE
jgi:hypothetical protein